MLIVVAVLAAVAALVLWRRAAPPPATSEPTAVAPAAPASPSPSAAPSSTHPSSSPTSGAAPTAPAAATPANLPPAPPEIAETLDRVSSSLMSAAKACGASLRSADDPAQQLRFRVDVAGAEVKHVARVDGSLPPGVADCIESKWRAARLAPVAAPLSLELEVAVRDLR